MLKRVLAYTLVLVMIVTLLALRIAPRGNLSTEEEAKPTGVISIREKWEALLLGEFDPWEQGIDLHDLPKWIPDDIIWLDIPGEPRPFKEVVFGRQDYTKEDEKLLAVITELHELSHRAVGYRRSPDVSHIQKALSLSGTVDSLIENTKFAPLIYDLLRVMKLMTEPTPDLNRWVRAHRIVHDIDFQLLDRVDKSEGDKTTALYWEASKAVLLWKIGTQHWITP